MFISSGNNKHSEIAVFLNVMPYVLVGVPVETRLFEDKPVLPPFLGEVAFSVLLFP